MATLRDQAIASFRKSPADASLEDLQYRLYVLEKIRKGEESLREHGPVSHAEAKRRMKKWLTR